MKNEPTYFYAAYTHLIEDDNGYPPHWLTDNNEVNAVIDELDLKLVYIHSTKTTVIVHHRKRSKTAYISTAVCSNKEQFVKRTGKMIAVNRLTGLSPSTLARFPGRGAQPDRNSRSSGL